MPRSRAPYPADFREQIVALARAGRSIESLSREFEPCVGTITNWIKLAGGEVSASSDALSVEERDELRRLRHEVRQLRQERDILSKAAAWFAQSELTSSRSTSS